MNELEEVIKDNVERVFDESIESFWNTVNAMVSDIETKEFGYFDHVFRPFPSIESREQFRAEFYLQISNLIKKES
jgi:hypothetical protein